MTELKGLNKSEVEHRLNLGQVNQYKEPTNRSYWQIVQENVFTFINTLLFTVAVSLLFLGKFSDAFVYATVVLVNILVSLIQEIRAKYQLDQISSLTKPKTAVLRDSEVIEIDSKNIVLDDIIVVSSGDLIPVDGVILEGVVDMDESLLSGESNLVTKKSGDEILSGTSVITGTVYFKATRIGSDSLANQITNRAKSYHKNLTPAQYEINITVRILFVISILLGGLNIFGALLAKTTFSEGLQVTAVILGIIPNSLFVIINLAYAIGAINILKKGALIQKLNAVESLSHVNVLCTDKTGTLTTNRFELVEAISFNSSLDKILADFSASISDPNPTVSAIQAKYKGKIHHHKIEIPFSSKYKWSGLVLDHPDLMGTSILGAPEILLQNMKPTSEQLDIISAAQNKGFRVLAFSYNNDILDLKDSSDQPKLPSNLNLAGILIFKNELRQNVEQTLQNFKQAGVEIKVISGDNPNTVLALVRQLNLSDELKAISGPELARLDNTDFKNVVLSHHIFGRITPDQKEKIVETLKNCGKYVAMIGDGINDVLSLKKANLSISMESGSQASRNVSDIILLNDSFESLPHGLIEGQKIRNSLDVTFKLYLTRVIYLILLIIAAGLANLPFPFSIKQSSLISLLTTGIPTLFLTFWAKPGISQSKKLIFPALDFVIPATLSLAIFGSILFFGFTFSSYIQLSDFAKVLDPESQSSVRTILTTFVTLCGLIMIIFVAPPKAYIGQKEHPSPSWKPTILAICIAACFGILFLVPAFSSFWNLQPLNALELLLVFVTVAAWALFLQFSWKADLLSKFLSRKSI